MIIDNVSTSLNGTRVECSYGGGVVSTDIINVIGNGTCVCLVLSAVMTWVSWKWLHRLHPSHTSHWSITVGPVQFENETVVVVLEWTVENGAFMSLSVVPHAEIVSLGPSSRQVMLSYNTIYNVNAVASLCGQYSLHSIELHYDELLQCWALLVLIVHTQHNPAKCFSPFRLLTEANKQV